MKYKGVPIESISIFKTPAIYLTLTLYILQDLVVWAKNFLLRRGISISILIALWITVTNINSLHVKPS